MPRLPRKGFCMTCHMGVIGWLASATIAYMYPPYNYPRTQWAMIVAEFGAETLAQRQAALETKEGALQCLLFRPDANSLPVSYMNCRLRCEHNPLASQRWTSIAYELFFLFIFFTVAFFLCSFPSFFSQRGGMRGRLPYNWVHANPGG